MLSIIILYALRPLAASEFNFREKVLQMNKLYMEIHSMNPSFGTFSKVTAIARTK